MERNIAVVGCGYWGKNLVRNFAELGALHTICDANAERLAQQVALYPGVNRETDFSRLLKREEIRGVVVATPAARHYSMTKEALLAGKDVLVEVIGVNIPDQSRGFTRKGTTLDYERGRFPPRLKVGVSSGDFYEKTRTD